MKEPSRAPFYAGIYPGLCDIARELGYALAIHGSLKNDLDLLAAPWTEEAKSAEDLVTAIKARLGAMGYKEIVSHQTGAAPELLSDQTKATCDESAKPHGRRAWLLYLDHGCSIDLSVMPRLS